MLRPFAIRVRPALKTATWLVLACGVVAAQTGAPPAT